MALKEGTTSGYCNLSLLEAQKDQAHGRWSVVDITAFERSGGPCLIHVRIDQPSLIGSLTVVLQVRVNETLNVFNESLQVANGEVNAGC